MAFYYYPPERMLTTTSVGHTFPENHWPLEHTRHRIGHALHDFVHPYEEQEVRNPRADIRETVKKYYIDIELPGLDKDGFALKWTSSRTLLVEAELKRPEVKEEVPAPAPAKAEPEAGPSQPQEAASSTAETPAANPGAKEVPPPTPQHPVHLLAGERRIGNYARAFHFSIDVEHDLVEAALQNGLLRIVLLKKETEHKEPKHVKVNVNPGDFYPGLLM